MIKDDGIRQDRRREGKKGDRGRMKRKKGRLKEEREGDG